MTEAIPGIHDLNDDVIELNDNHWFFSSYIPSNQKLTVDKNGQPVLIDIIDNLSDDDKIEINKLKQQQLINDANSQITLLQRAVKYNLATTAQKQLLEQLELYTVQISNIDISESNVDFPPVPE